MSQFPYKLAEAIRIVGRGKLSRRDFVQLAIAGGMSAATASAMFVQAARAEPKRGGMFRIAVGSGATTDGLDPAVFPDTFNGLFGSGSLRSTLTEIDAQGKVVGDLVESFEASNDAKTWVFKLRKGVEFHNGKSLEPADVVTSINHHRGAGSRSAKKSLLASVDEVKVDGKETVVFTLDAGNADFAYIVSDYQLPVMPAQDGKADFASGIGTGPYVMTGFEPGVKGSGKRFANYHGQTWFDEIEVLSMIDVAARTNALTSGQVEYIDRVDPRTLRFLEADPNVTIAEVAGFAHYVAPMNCTVAPFDNKDVRLALKYAVNREDIVEKVLLGHGTPGNDNPIAAGVPFSHDPQIKHRYELERAKFHLKRAGFEKLIVDLSAADAAFAGAVDAALLMKDSAAAAGININVIREPNDAYWDNVWMKKPWCMSYWTGRPTPDLIFTTAYAAGAAWNETYWKNDHFNQLLLAARSELDVNKRAVMYAEMQDLVADDGGVIVLMFYNYLAGHAKTLAHGTIASNWDVDGMNITKRWWFA